jgi:hypothetical protein
LPPGGFGGDRYPVAEARLVAVERAPAVEGPRRGAPPTVRDLTGPSRARPVAPVVGADEPSLRGLRVVVVVVVVLGLTAAVCSRLLPIIAVTPKSLIKDSFERTAQGLGTTDTGQEWRNPTAGTWNTASGEAFVAEPNPDPAGRTIAVVDLGSDNGSVGATISGSSAGWGLVFRYRGPAEYWAVIASAKLASYNIIHITKGRLEPVDRIAMARQSPGTPVEVQFQGPKVTVLIDGKPVKTVTDPDGGNGGNLVGMVLGDGSSTAARWRDFEGRRLSLSPDPRVVTTRAGSSTTASQPAGTTAATTGGG